MQRQGNTRRPVNMGSKPGKDLTCEGERGKLPGSVEQGHRAITDTGIRMGRHQDWLDVIRQQ
jgi:hypothetical protein